MPPVTADTGRLDGVTFSRYTLLEGSNIKWMRASHVCAYFPLGGFQAQASNQFSGLGKMDLHYGALVGIGKEKDRGSRPRLIYRI